jgi:hypothetical protein
MYSPTQKEKVFLDAKDVKHLMRKSLRWVYDHASELGGRKIGGSWFFTEEGLSDAISGREKVAGKSDVRGAKTYGLVRNEKAGQGMGSRKKKKIKAEGPEHDANRHGLGSFLQ